MRKLMKQLVLLTFVLCLSRPPGSSAAPSAALLIVAHGAPSKSWSQPVLQLAQKVDTALRQHPGPAFVRVSAAFLEFSRPSIADAVAELTRAGADTVFVLPLFVAPSSHTLRDLPNVLGHTADPEVLAQLADEGTKIVRTSAHVIVGPTLAYGDFLQRALVRQAAALSQNPDSEAVVILAHGDEDFAPIWEKMLTRAGGAVCGRTGITWFDFATIETGQTFLQNGLPVIRQALDARPRVLVLGLYVNLPASRIAERYRDKLFGAAGSLRNRDVAFSDKALIDDPELPVWLAELALRIRRAYP